MSRIWIGLLGIGAVALVACSQAPTQGTQGGPGGAPGKSQASRVAAVSVATVATGPIRSVLSYSGGIQAKNQVNIVPKATGRIEKIMVDVGDSVKAGDPLVQMESASAKVAVQQAQATLSSAQAKLETIKAGSRVEDIASAEAAVRNAQARIDQLTPADSDLSAAQAALVAAQTTLTKAQTTLNTLKDPSPNDVALAQDTVEKAKAALWNAQAGRDGQCGHHVQYLCDQANASVMSADSAANDAQAKLNALLNPIPEDIANAQQSVDSAQAAVNSAQAKLDQLKAGPKEADLAVAQSSLDQAQSQLSIKQSPYTAQDLKSAQAAVDQAQASLDSARLTLSDTTVTAPFDGVVSVRSLSEGALASAQTPVLSLVSKDIQLAINVEESKIGQFRPGLPVTLTVSAYPGTTFSGQVSSIAPVADSKSHTFSVIVTPDNSSGKLSTGMFADLQVTAADKPSAVLVTKDAVMQQGDKQVVFVAKDGQASLKTIQAGVSDDKNIEVLNGLAPGDQVVTSGQASLNDGDRITIPGQGGAGQQGGQGGPPQKGQGQGGNQQGGNQSGQQPAGAASSPTPAAAAGQ